MHLLKNLIAKVFKEGQRVQLHKLLAEGASRGETKHISTHTGNIAEHAYFAQRPAHFFNIPRMRPEAIMHSCNKFRQDTETTWVQDNNKHLRKSVLVLRSRLQS
jgi:hypothetical protein